MTVPIESYEELQYDAKAIPEAHPDRIHTVARARRLAAAPPDRCAMLDVGCADGTHLIGLALEYPHSRFVGVELSERQVALGRATIAELGLENIVLHQGDLGSLEAEASSFDYIMAHGFYSWVSARAREQLLASLRRLLAPEGIAYLGYAVYPGAYWRIAVREMLLPFLRDATSANIGPRFRALARAFAEGLQPWVVGLKEQLLRASKASNSAVAHDWCATYNQPDHFAELARELERHELRFAGEMSLSASEPGRLNAAGRRVLSELGADSIRREACFDILSNNGFRRSLIVRSEVDVPSAPLDAGVVRQALLGAIGLIAEERPVLKVRSRSGIVAELAEPLVKAAFLGLHERRPEMQSFDELRDSCARSLGSHQGLDAKLERAMFELYATELVDVRHTRPKCSAIVSSQPQASALARLQAARAKPGAPVSVTNQQHFPVELEPSASSLLQLLDGTRNRDVLLERWRKDAKDATLAKLATHLTQFAGLALLVA
jgi:SAM-dependent methyltransferase/methyltransferase-like protein